MDKKSRPVRVAWIEIQKNIERMLYVGVSRPVRVAWIEIARS